MLGHPIVGASWEGFLIETILNSIDPEIEASFYRTAAGAEIDLVLVRPGGGVTTIEIKRSLAPKISRGFQTASADVEADHRFVLYPGEERYPLGESIHAIGLPELLRFLVDA